jgi:hypothetical protein
MPKLIFIINGVGGSGKDTFVEMCRELSRIPVFNISSIDPVRNAVKVLDPDFSKTEAGRKFLADVKRAWAEYNDGPTQYLKQEVDQISDGLIFLHVREPEQISHCQELIDGVKTLLIRRPESPTYENGADDRTEEIDYDFVIENEGDLAALQQRALDFLQQIGNLSTDQHVLSPATAAINLD